MMKTQGRPMGCMVLALLTSVVTLRATTRTWIGEGTDALAGTAENWSDSTAPVAGDHVVLDDAHAGNAQTNIIWDLDIEVGSWTQTEDYDGVVTIQTRYPGVDGEGTTFTNLTVLGDILLDGGVWTHPANTGVNAQHDRLAVSAGGNFTLGAMAAIDLDGKGFAAERGPGAGEHSARSGSGISASHGGEGAYGQDAENPSVTYGSITAPIHLGSGGGTAHPGGGALRLDAGLVATINGSITVNGICVSNQRPHGSGGSIYIRAGEITGTTGLLQARAALSTGYWGGGGGRISLVATNTTSAPNGLTLDAFGGPGTRQGDRGADGLAGTIFIQTLAGQRLIINQNDRRREGEDYMYYTDLPAVLHDLESPPGIDNPFSDAALRLENLAQVRLTDSIRIGDLEWICETSTLDLSGFTLFFKEPKPAGFPDMSEPSTTPITIPSEMGGGTVYPNGGRIIWDDEPFTIPVLLWTGPNGSADGFDPDMAYPYGSNLTVTAVANPGYDFVRWLGSLPESQNPENEELTFTVLPGKYFRAVFASSAAGTRTWIGDANTDSQAATAENWYPQSVPETGHEIVLNDASFVHTNWNTNILLVTERWEDWIHHAADLEWDLDGIEPASWTQTEDYYGTVTVRTRYPEVDGVGTTFTNLTVTGNIQIEGGTWTHPANTGNHEQHDRLAVSAGGNFTLGTNAVINLVGKGFEEERGPGAGTTGLRTNADRAASHGGIGGYLPAEGPANTYGSFILPETLGSGGGSDMEGGGAVRLHVGGNAVLNGLITVAGQGNSMRACSAGGSILILADTVSGDGFLVARGGGGYWGGGGGRIAVYLRSSKDFGDLQFDARGANGNVSHSGTDLARSSAGTIYLEGVDVKNRPIAVLRIDNQGIVTPLDGNMTTPIPDDVSLPVTPELSRAEHRHIELEILNQGQLSLGVDGYFRDLFIDTQTDSRLHLQGNTLDLAVPYHDDWGHDDWVVYDGGEIVWTPVGTIFFLR